MDFKGFLSKYMKAYPYIILFVVIFFGCGPGSVEQLDKARSLMQHGEFAVAMDLLDKIIADDASSQAAYNMRGIANLELGHTDKAISDFDRSVTLDSSDYRSFYNRGNAYYRNENFEKAVEDYNFSLGLSPKEKDIYINRGNALMQLNKVDEAILDYKFALKIDPNNFLAHFNLARGYYLAGNMDMAKTSFEHCLQIQDAYAPAYYFLGMISLEREEMEAACILWQKALDLGYQQAEAVQKLYCAN